MQCNAARAAQHKKSNPHTDVVGNWKRFILKGNVEFLTFHFETCPHMDKKRQRTTYNTNKHMAVCQNLLPPFGSWLSMGFLTNPCWQKEDNF